MRITKVLIWLTGNILLGYVLIKYHIVILILVFFSLFFIFGEDHELARGIGFLSLFFIVFLTLIAVYVGLCILFNIIMYMYLSMKKGLYILVAFSVWVFGIGLGYGIDLPIPQLVKETPNYNTNNDYIDYKPNETDIVLKDNTLTNVPLLEKFIDIAGQKGSDNESQIRIVTYVAEGAIIYDLQSRYDATVGHRWIDVTPDLSHYTPGEESYQDVFNSGPQQCGYMEKDTQSEEWFYKLYECRTNWEYRILPVVEEKLN